MLSNKGEVVIQGKTYPVVGRVCMDMMMVDLGKHSRVTVGEEVVLFGSQRNDIYELCRRLNTIPYEITCWISSRVPRVYINNDLHS